MTVVSATKDGFFVSSDPKLMQLDRIYMYLSGESYWAKGIPRDVLQRAVENSICFGVFDQDRKQVGFARVVTDHATFAWLCDVYIDPALQGRGLGKFLMETVMTHPSLQHLRRILLATKGAHGLYEKVGFKPTATPSYWMEVKKPDIYSR